MTFLPNEIPSLFVFLTVVIGLDPFFRRCSLRFRRRGFADFQSHVVFSFCRHGLPIYPNRLSRNSAVMALMILDHKLFRRHGFLSIIPDYEIELFLPSWPFVDNPRL
jgi:hypothetical protein